MVVAAQELRRSWRPALGEHIYIEGTGKWWAGHHFGAVVVDIRKEDGSIKVRYTDGGFKRFKAEELAQLVTQKASTPQMWEEWTDSTHEEHVTELQQLHEDIMNATRAKDPERAAVLSKQFQALAARKDELGDLEVQLRDAVARGDFLRAHEVKQRIIALQADGRPDGDFSVPAGGPAAEEEVRPVTAALQQAAARSLSGGLAGASAMLLQVTSLMWLRTTMNYQYRYGMGTWEAMKFLYEEGGILRFYRGIGPALLQGPLSRFGDTAANAGVLALFDETEARTWPAAVKTVFASGIAASMRIALVPLDTLKTVLQVESRRGMQVLAAKYIKGGTPVLFHGAMATSAATFVGHYPWFTTFNTLNEAIPDYNERPKRLLRNAGIGFCASVVSDTVVNSLRVLKTCRQTDETLSYGGIIQKIVKEDGVAGLFGRGLKTRIIANGCSGIVFSVLYKTFEEQFSRASFLRKLQ